MMNIDWDKEADKDYVYALEREKLMEQSYYDSIIVKPAKITYKKNENRSNTRTLRRNHEKGSKPRLIVSTPIDKG